MDLIIKKPKDYRNMDWNNLTSRSTEIVRNEESPSEYIFDWRVAIDDIPVPGGALPPFPSYMRYFSVLSGIGVNLVIDGQYENTLNTFEQVKFEGSSIVNVTTLAGPVRDLNLIFNNELYTGRLQWYDLPSPHTYESTADVIIIFAAAPQVIVTIDQLPTTLMNEDTLILTRKGSKELILASPTNSPSDHACMIELFRH